METSTYDAQAAEFLARFGLTVKVELRTPETCPEWAEADRPKMPKSSGTCPRCGTIHGREYLVTLTGAPKDAENAARWRFRPSLSFAYWGAHADRPGQPKMLPNGKRLIQDETGALGNLLNKGKHPSAYDVLACLSGDVSTPDDPDEVVREFGDMLPSRALSIVAHGRKVRAFFTADELAALAEIQ